MQKYSIRPAAIRVTVLAAVLLAWPTASLATTVSAGKSNCEMSCVPTGAGIPITLKKDQEIEWCAMYSGSGTQGNDFYLTKSSAANKAEILLTDSLVNNGGQTCGKKFLNGSEQGVTYYISINLFHMGNGNYHVKFDPNGVGEPHIRTASGHQYDFQGSGEFIFLRGDGKDDGRNRTEIQTRMSAIATSVRPGRDPSTDLAVCVSVNSAIAVRVGRHRVTYQPNLSGQPDPTGLQLRVDGKLTSLPSEGLRLQDGGRLLPTAAPGGLQIDFPDRSSVMVTPGWWPGPQVWYLNVEVVHNLASDGIAGDVPREGWLPNLPDGTAMGPKPQSEHERYVALYQRFADAWRVTDADSLFDYAPSTSTKTFTLPGWPTEEGPCTVPGMTEVVGIEEAVAKQACQSVIGGANESCVYDVMQTGNVGFATTYALGQSVRPIPRATPQKCSRKLVVVLIVVAGVLLILLLACVALRRSARARAR